MDIAAKVEEMKRKAEALAREAARRSEQTGSADPAESNAPSSEDD